MLTVGTLTNTDDIKAMLFNVGGQLNWVFIRTQASVHFELFADTTNCISWRLQGVNSV